MFDLLESIALKDGILLNAAYHEKRFRHAYTEYYKQAPSFKLLQDLDITLPEQGYYKLRIQYNKGLKKADITSYKAKEIKSLKCIRHNTIDYHLKYTNRQLLNELMAQRGACDDILIIKNGYLSDTFAGNILLDNGTEWVTPDSPLLPGTQRAFLLDQGLIKTQAINESEIQYFKRFMVINAMRPFDKNHSANIKGII